MGRGRSDTPERRRFAVSARELCRWTKAYGGIGYREDVIAFRVRDVDGCGHAGPELQIGVIGVNDRVVGNDVLDGLCRIADLANLTLETLPRERIDGKCGRHARFEPAHVTFRNIRVNLHCLQIFGDGEENRCLQRRRNSLADIDGSRDDGAIDR